MVNKYTYKPLCSKEKLEELYNSGMTQIEIAEDLGVSQKVVWSHMKKFNLTARVAKKRNQWGVKNSSWKGDDAGYAMLHKRVQEVRGNPKVCEVCGTLDAKRYEWANLTGKYEDVLDYKRMCKKCHYNHDKKSYVRNKKGQWGGDVPCQS